MITTAFNDLPVLRRVVRSLIFLFHIELILPFHLALLVLPITSQEPDAHSLTDLKRQPFSSQAIGYRGLLLSNLLDQERLIGSLFRDQD